MESWPKRPQRHSVRLDASATRSGGAEVRAIVTDLSLDGCCLVGPFRLGEQVVVNIPRIGRLAAEIRWAVVGRAGARFIRTSDRRLDSRGVATIEYALLASLIALALLGAWANVGQRVENNFDEVNRALPSATEYNNT